jgi:hypothetical protein
LANARKRLKSEDTPPGGGRADPSLEEAHMATPDDGHTLEIFSDFI